MKNLFLFLMAGAIIACNSTDKSSVKGSTDENAANEAAMKDTANYTTIQWLDSTHIDLGKITEGQVVELSWRLKNTGSKPLIIQNAQGTCGCTIAEKPTEPIPPGGESVIKAKFDSHNQNIGTVRKTVTVLANTQGNTGHYLSFSADINK
jgi:hypothetical protein